MRRRVFSASLKLLSEEWIRVGDKRLCVRYVRNPRAKRLIVRLQPDLSARVTVPRGLSVREARAFLEKHASWLKTRLRERERLRADRLGVGDQILLRGRPVTIEPDPERPGWIRFGDQRVRVEDGSGGLAKLVRERLFALAAEELPARALAYARVHGFRPAGVRVGNPRTRWGSCSSKGRVNLNWRLIQAPPFARDYVILHELVHLEHPNHSAEFWARLRTLCPGCEIARRWLSLHGPELMHAW